MTRRVLPLLVTVATSVACSDPATPPGDTSPPPVDTVTVEAPTPPFTLTVETGASGSVRTMESVSVTARIAGTAGRPVPGVAVHWSVRIPFPEWGPDIAATMRLAGMGVDTTDADGRVTRTLRFPYPADWRLTASTDTTDSASASVSVTPADPADVRLAWEDEAAPVRMGLRPTAATDGSRIWLMPGQCPLHSCPTTGAEMAVLDPDVGWSTAPAPPGYPGAGGEGGGVAGVTSEGIHFAYPGRHHVFDAAAGTWSERPAPPAAADPFVGATVGGRLWLFGADSVWAYEVASGSWRAAGPSPVPGRLPAVSARGTDIYVASPGDTNAFLRFDTEAGAWTSLPEMPATLSMSSAGAWVGDRFCVFGGGVDLGRPYVHFRQTYCYDLATSAWSAEASMPHGCTFWPTAVTLGGTTYLFGGDEGQIGSGGNNVPCERLARARATG